MGPNESSCDGVWHLDAVAQEWSLLQQGSVQSYMGIAPQKGRRPRGLVAERDVPQGHCKTWGQRAIEGPGSLGTYRHKASSCEVKFCEVCKIGRL